MDNEETLKNENGAESTISPSLNSTTKTQTKNGQDKLLTAKESLDQFNQDLENYLIDQGINLNRIEHCLDIPYNELVVMTSDQLLGIAYEIYCYNTHLQQIINKKLTDAEKLKSKIEKIIAKDLYEYRFFQKDERWACAIANNHSAQVHRNYEVMSRAVVNRLSFMSQRLDNVAKCLEEMGKKRRHG